MPSISFSPANMTVQAGYNLGDASLGKYLFHNNLVYTDLSQASFRYMHFRIYKGTEPSNFANFVSSKTFYDSDKLLTIPYTLQTDPVVTTIVANDSYKVSYHQDINATATGSGTATWFWAYFDLTQNDTGNATSPRIMFRGTCGAVGSGADMELDYPSIVSGSEYLITNLCSFTINLEYSWV